MDQELLYSNLVMTMKFLNNKQRSKPDQQDFYHANLVMAHFLQCKQMFAHTAQVHKALLNYYEQRWVLKDEVSIDETDSQIFIHELRKESQVNVNVCQFVVQLLIVGLNTLMSKDIEKKVNKQMKNIYSKLKMTLIFEDKSPTDILKPYVQKLVKEIKNFQFFEILLKIFKQIDNFSIVSFLQKTISNFRQQWQKNQLQMKENLTHKRKTRQTALFTSPKQVTSLPKNPTIKEKNQDKENNREFHKTTQKKLQVQKSNFNSIKLKPKIAVNQRQSFYGKSYQFIPRVSTSNFNSSQESISFNETRFSSQQSSRLTLHGGKGRQKLDLIDEDCLCEGTPDKMKKIKK